ncbi:MAG: serine/threonine protein kinase [Deltaproteobacteria bacterium]|nr:serine/threonine protein kinase [Deltaproteobacteria bacterium]
MDEPLTKSLERYDVLDRIAVGGMAEVFLAKAYGAHGFEKTLAIKRILPELARDPEFEARFIAEAKVAVRLSHANVVQVLDFGRIGASLFIAMEYVDGLDLAAMLRKFKDEGRQVPLPAAFHIAIEIIRALDFAHGHNVVHRDVSPSNVLISRAGEVKIADFGIAVAAQPHRGGGPGPRKVMGKWRYMSPEQARGDTLDTRSDLFSAATVIYELFTGEKLFPGDEAEDIIKNLNEMPIPKMAALRPGLPSRLDDVIGAAFARKPIDRPTRPATVLRSLIELSYESSIMATALDVAEALATVIPAKRQSGRGALDDVIRKQLSDQSHVARRTAVTDGQPPSTETAERGEHSTGLFRKVDLDGLSRLEEVEATRVAAPRAKRNSEQGGPMPGDTDLHALYDASKDRDRHTEVGGPPTGQVPKNLAASNTKLPQVSEKSAVVAPRRGLWWMILLVMLGGGFGVWMLTRGGEERSPVALTAAGDGGVIEDTGTLILDPDPEGAAGYVEVAGDPSSRKTISRLAHDKLFSAKVPVNAKLHVHLELSGYTPYDDIVTLAPGERLRFKPRLVTAPARLHVVTDPPGAQVTVAGRSLGDSPNTFENLTPAGGAVLTLGKPGFTTITRAIDLKAGQTTEVSETLKPIERFGLISVKVEGGGNWGEVSVGGRHLGRNQSPTGLRQFRLPVGRQHLTIVNGPAKQSKTVAIDVTEGQQTITVTLE